MTALQIAALKRLGRGSTVFLLDRNGGSAVAVAKELNKKGFKKAFVVSGGKMLGCHAMRTHATEVAWVIEQ